MEKLSHDYVPVPLLLNEIHGEIPRGQGPVIVVAITNRWWKNHTSQRDLALVLVLIRDLALVLVLILALALVLVLIRRVSVW